MWTLKLLFLLSALLMGLVYGAEEIADDVKEILAWDPPKSLKKQFPYFVTGFDGDGSPISVLEFGRWDMRAVMEKGAEDPEVQDLVKYTLQMFHNWAESPNIFKTDVNTFVIIVDLEGYDNRQFTHGPTVSRTIDMARQYSRIIGKKGLDKFKKMILVNSNYLFSSLYGVMKPIFGTLATKMDLHGTNKEKWLPEIRKIIPRDQIPEWLGGVSNHKPVKVYGK